MLGLIFGETNFPLEILKNVKKKHIKYLIIDLTKKKNFKKDIPRIVRSSKLGDAAILSEIIKILKHERISTISSLTYNPELTLKKGTYSKIKPNKDDNLDIKKAISTLGKLGKYTFSQGTVVRNNKVVVIEGKEGTERMLKINRTKTQRNKGVLV